ncbi:DoxX family protein [Flavobacterium sp.]|uniref:DoxX family protein n=1 Tax=Flavobacterium sp. TaxID=239 RepID=UPI0037536275
MEATIKARNKWANAHTSYWLDALRIILGTFLIYKGISFITNTVEFDGIVSSTEYFNGGMISFHYISAAHIMGGIMIIFGLLTRWAILAQLPILFGAVIINFFGELNSNNLTLATLTLAISLFFLYFGSGKHSADYYFKMNK